MLFFTPGCASCEDAARAVASASQPATSDARFLAIDLDPSGDPETVSYRAVRVATRSTPAESSHCDTTAGYTTSASAAATPAPTSSSWPTTYTSES